MEYPEVSGSNLLTQRIFPLQNIEVVNQKVDSSNPIEVSWVNGYWGDLVKSGDSDYTLLDVSACIYWVVVYKLMPNSNHHEWINMI